MKRLKKKRYEEERASINYFKEDENWNDVDNAV